MCSLIYRLTAGRSPPSVCSACSLTYIRTWAWRGGRILCKVGPQCHHFLDHVFVLVSVEQLLQHGQGGREEVEVVVAMTHAQVTALTLDLQTSIGSKQSYYYYYSPDKKKNIVTMMMMMTLLSPSFPFFRG